MSNTGEDAGNNCEFTHSRGCNYSDVVRGREGGREGGSEEERGVGGTGSLGGIVILIGWRVDN